MNADVTSRRVLRLSLFLLLPVTRTLRAVGFSYAKREKPLEQPSAFPSSMREFGTYAARDTFDVNFICQYSQNRSSVPRVDFK